MGRFKLNTDTTYRFANKVISDLDLNVITYIPKQTAAHRDVTMNGIPGVNDEQHTNSLSKSNLSRFAAPLMS